MVDFLTALFFPPGLNIFLLVLGFVVQHWWKWTGRLIMMTGIVSLYLFSTLAVGDRLLYNLQKYPALQNRLQLNGDKDSAIVVLGAGRRRQAPEYSKEDIINPLTMERLRYAVILSKKYKLPLLLSGGEPDHEATPEAVLMNQLVVEDLQQPVKFLETQSKNTWENALNSVKLLKNNDISRVILVTHAWHMKRAFAYFQATGIDVIPAPMGFVPRKPFFSSKIRAFYPSATGLLHSRMAIKEYVALWWNPATFIRAEQTKISNENDATNLHEKTSATKKLAP